MSHTERRLRAPGPQGCPSPEALAQALLEAQIDQELGQAFAADLSRTLLAGFQAWCLANLAKTQSPHEVFVGLGMFVQDAIATLWLATTTEEAGKARYLREWWQMVREGLPRRQAELLAQRQGRGGGDGA